MNKTGRNDLCPCGSGKKFKKCCESKGKTKALNPERVSLQQPPMSSGKVSSLFQRTKSIVPPENKKPDNS
ncbi:MAG TPA: SEC-C metal-binding domain-containing protein [Candidatus Rhabdochlamydia sp.]|jgi:SEC-C motif|nr:SEC-C metal-binding domain-containing protein [Candidatus Rhabdochlamydia sp.]